MSGRVAAVGTPGRSPAGWLWWLLPAALIGVIAWFARTGAVSPRIANPEVTGVPRPVEVLFGFDYWLELQQFFCVVAMIVLIVVCIQAWRRQPGHPYVLMAIASTAIVWQDPIMNWAPYAVYNPQLWHWPEDWPLINLSPTVEPFVVIGYALFYFGPYFPAVWILTSVTSSIMSITKPKTRISPARLHSGWRQTKASIVRFACMGGGIHTAGK